MDKGIKIKGGICKKRIPIRGGNWNNGSNAGVFYLNLNNSRTNVNTNIGGRLAFITSVILKAMALRLCNETKGDVDLADKINGRTITCLNTVSNLI